MNEHVEKRKLEEGLCKKCSGRLHKVGQFLVLACMFNFKPVDALVPEGLEVQHVTDEDGFIPKFERWHTEKFHPLSVVICSTRGEGLLSEVARALELKGGNAVYITRQWGWGHDGFALKLYDTSVARTWRYHDLQ